MASFNKLVSVQIEIPSGQNVKYEIDHITHQLRCDRFLHGPYMYPFNYGFIPYTLSLDGDPLDAVVICNRSLLPTCFIDCKIIGALLTEDEKGQDEKILLVPSEKIDPYNKNINNYKDLDQHTIDEIKYFFEHYKDMEKGKFIKVGDFVNTEEAINIYERCIDNYKNEK
jgi:inorganic pyrophosphatase